MNAVHSTSLPCLLLPAFLWIWFKKVCSLTSLKARVHLELFSSLSTLQKKSLVMSLSVIFFPMALAKNIHRILVSCGSFHHSHPPRSDDLREQTDSKPQLGRSRSLGSSCMQRLFSQCTKTSSSTFLREQPPVWTRALKCRPASYSVSNTVSVHDGYHYLIISWLIQVGLKNKAKMFKLWKKEKTNKYLAFSSCATVNETSLPLSDGRPDWLSHVWQWANV